jgi:hypothetical protein
MRAIPKLSVAVLLWAMATGAAFADTVQYKADLEPSSEVPPTDSHGHGMLQATFDTSTHELKYDVTYEGLTGKAMAAHFHGPAPVGENAKVQVPVSTTALAATTNTVNGEAKLTDAQASDLMAGKWYFNIHTAAHPAGEIRGQVVPAQ